MHQDGEMDIDRREFLRRSATAAAGLTGAAAFLAACADEGSSTLASPSEAPDTITLPRPGSPVSLPLFDDNPAVLSDAAMEAGPLKIYQWKSYLYDEILDDFRSLFDVELVVENFTDMDEAVTEVRSGRMSDFDVFFPSIGYLGPMVQERLVRPLNHDLLPNIKDLWRYFREPDAPFYDAGQRYTVPYTVYGTGIAWRKDILPRADWPTSLDDPYDAFWMKVPQGKVGIYDDYREALSMALLRNGVEDVNTDDPAAIDEAASALVEAARKRGVMLGDDGAYEGIPEGEFALHQSWSGDILSASSGKRYGDQASNIGYLWPKGGVIGADLTAVLANGQNPVLAHAFVNFLMDCEVAWTNYSWNGYQPPVMMPSEDRKWAPAVPTVTLQESDLEDARWLCPLEPQVDALWHAAWDRVRGVAELEED